MPFWLGAAIVFIYGAVVGSFLNVLICRLPNEESIVFPPSHCPKCNTKLRGWDLIPLLSFLAMGRRCRYCGEPISWRYFIVEATTALIFVGLYWRYGFRLDFFALALLSAALIAVFFIDLEHFIIPDQLSVFGIVLGVARDVLGIILHERAPALISIPFTQAAIPIPASIPGLIVCGGIFYLIAEVGARVFRAEAMGGGDIKLAAAIGANLLLVKALVSFFVAVCIGGIISIVLLIGRKRGRKDLVPFGPMMVAGVFAVTLAYPQLTAGWQAWQGFIIKLVGG